MKVRAVCNGSVGEELGITPDDSILSADGFPFVDILDYEFCDGSESFTMSVLKQSGVVEELEIEKNWDEPLGLSFEDDGLSVKRCKNQCVFCFVDQLPPDPDLRITLRVKDDDYRHSFLYGAFVTATNFSSSDIARIKRLRLSPLYISVHSTDENIRKQMLGIKNAPPVLSLIKELSEAGICIHAQIVYCPGFNEDTEQTARHLFPYCQSLAVVPVGLTKFQNPALKPVTKQAAEALLDLVDRLQSEFFKKKGTRFIWCADEFYFKAKRKIPCAEFYENYPQIDNGVGLIAKFLEDFDYAIEEAAAISLSELFMTPKKISVAVGESAFDCIFDAALKVEKMFGKTVAVHKVRNEFFGPSVTVTGLLTGSDLLKGLKGKDLGERLLLPSVMFRADTEEFLDKMTLSGLQAQLGVPVVKVPSDGESFLYAVLGIEDKV